MEAVEGWKNKWRENYHRGEFLISPHVVVRCLLRVNALSPSNVRNIRSRNFYVIDMNKHLA